MKKVFAVLALIALVAAFAVGCNGEADNGNGDEALYQNGTYTGTAEGYGGELTVEVTVAGGEITAVDVTDHSETAGISDAAIEEVPAQIVENQGTDGVDTVTNATVTSEAILEAAEEALNKAK